MDRNNTPFLKRDEVFLKEGRMDKNRKIIIGLFLIMTCILLSSNLPAQEQKDDIVYLVNGSSMRGTIIEIKKDIMTFRKKDGTVVELKTSEVMRFSSNRPVRKLYREETDQGIEAPKKSVETEVFDKTAKESMTSEIISKHSVQIAPVIYRFEYEEPTLMSEKGFMHGVAGKYAYNNRTVMFGLSIEYAAGELDYDGSTWGGTPVSANTEDYILEFRSLIGGNIHKGRSKITPFIGFGVRYWNDTIKGSGGYEREILYYYSPIGVKTVSPLSDSWFWSLNAEYDLFWKGQVKSHLSDADPGFNDPEVNQSFGDGFGIRFSLQFKNKISEKFSWYIEPFFRYWDVGESDTAILALNGVPIGLVYEPDNNTTSYGLYIGFKF